MAEAVPEPVAIELGDEEIDLRLFCASLAADCKRGGMTAEDVVNRARILRSWVLARDHKVAQRCLAEVAKLHPGQTDRFLVDRAESFYHFILNPDEEVLELVPAPEPAPEPEAPEPEGSTHSETSTMAETGSELPATPSPQPPPTPPEGEVRRPVAKGRKKEVGNKKPPS